MFAQRGKGQGSTHIDSLMYLMRTLIISDQGSTPKTLFNLSYLLRGPSPNKTTLRGRASMYKFEGAGGFTHSFHSRKGGRPACVRDWRGLWCWRMDCSAVRGGGEGQNMPDLAGVE